MPPTRPRASRLLPLIALLLAAAPRPGLAQGGPPPHVRRLVDAVVALLQTRDDAGIERFMESAVDPAWPARAGRDAVLERVRQVRGALAGPVDDIGVEREGDGVTVILSGGGAERRVGLALSEAGIGDLRLAGEAGSQDAARGAAVRAHVAALEGSGRQDPAALVREFEERHFSAAYLAETTHDARRALLERIRAVAAGAGGVQVGERDGGEIVVKLRGPQSLGVVFTVGSGEPYAIDSLRTEDVDADAPRIELTWEGAGATFAELALRGFSGVVHLARHGETVLHAAYGMSNPDLGYATRIDTAYCIGSTPIDFTVAAINLLTQRGKLDPDATLGTFFDGVPADKESMTVTHLITGRSGLPNFHDVPGVDWDADLAWIDRQTAVRRILAQPLLFPPGGGRAHSHSAYGLAAAIVEIVSGQDYFTFLRESFFEPAGMTRTGMYGVTGGLSLADFAVGRGASSVGLPNIPPNWGPTSWLVLGSGGMYSTLDDLLRFRAFVTSDKLFEPRFARRYDGQSIGIGGSDRGFYVFHASMGREAEALMMINGEGRSPEVEGLSRALERLVMGATD